MSEESVKVVLLGESGVGKTSIITQFIEENFSDDQQSTTGATYSNKEVMIGQKVIKFEIWDTAGQEKYRSLTKMFYKDAAVAILVYDITRLESFNEVKDYWIDQVKELSPKNIKITIAANKSDLIEEEQVDEEMGREFAKNAGAMFRSTSAKNANGIEEMFNAIAKQFAGQTEEEENKNNKGKKRETVKITKTKAVENDKDKKKGCCK